MRVILCGSSIVANRGKEEIGSRMEGIIDVEAGAAAGKVASIDRGAQRTASVVESAVVVIVGSKFVDDVRRLTNAWGSTYQSGVLIGAVVRFEINLTTTNFETNSLLGWQ